MQRTETDGIVLSCDFCHRDWDGQEPMIEGHHGSIICLPCLHRALAEQRPASAPHACTLCLRRNLPAGDPCWSPDPAATICASCITLAARTFSKSPLTDWQYNPPA